MYSFSSLLLLAHIICASNVTTFKASDGSILQKTTTEVFQFGGLQAELMKINDSQSQRPDTSLASTEPLEWLDAMQGDAEYRTFCATSSLSGNDGAYAGRPQYRSNSWNNGCGRNFGDETEEQGVQLINDGKATPEIDLTMYPKNRIPLNFGTIARPTSVGVEKSSSRPVGKGHSTVASGNRRVPLEKGRIGHGQPVSAGGEKPSSRPVGKGYSTAASDNQKAPLNRGKIEHGRPTFVGGKKPSSRPDGKSHPTATSGNQKIPLERGKIQHRGPTTLATVPTRGKMSLGRKIVPLRETFLKDFKFNPLRHGNFEISWGEEYLFLKRMRKNQFGFLGNFRMHFYLIYTPSKAVHVSNNFVYKLRDVHYVVCTNREIYQEEIGPLWSLLEPKDGLLFNWWLRASIIGAFTIQG